MKKIILLAFLFLASPALACDVVMGKYNQAKTVNFCLYTLDATVGAVKVESAVHASGDTYLMKDEGAEANTTNAFTDEGSCYSIALTATEMQAARITLNIEDQGTKTWADKCIVIETYGNASAEHALDLDTATVNPGTGGITSSSFASGAIDATAIAADAIGASEIATDAIGAAELAADAIGASEIATDAIGATELAANSITSSEVADDSIDAGAIAASAIGASEIAADAIGADEIAANAITSAEVANGALTSAKFGYDGTLTSESGTTLGLASGAVDADDQFNTGYSLVVFDSGGLISARSCIADSTNVGDTVVTSEDISALVAVADNYAIVSDAGCAANVERLNTNITAVTNLRAMFDGTGYAGGTTKLAVNATQWNGTAVAAPHTAGYPICTIKDGTGTGEIDTSSGAVVSVATATNLTNLPTIPADWITAAGIAADAIGASELASNAVGAAELAADALAEINAEVVDVLTVDTHAELSGVPSSTPTIKQMLQWVYQLMKFKITQTSTTSTAFKDDGSTSLATSTTSDDGTTFTRGEYN